MAQPIIQKRASGTPHGLAQRLTQWISHLHPLRSRIMHDPYYRFQSFAEVQLAVSLGIRLEVNQATIDDWLRLPGLSIHQARTLVTLTQAGIPLTCLEDIAAALGLPVRSLQPYQDILRFCYYDPESLNSLPRVNPNQASVDQLVRIPLISFSLAQALVHERQRAGSYRHLADLQQRLALSPQLVANLLHYLQF